MAAGRIVLPRGWDFQDRFGNDFALQFRGRQINITQSPIGCRVGATVWDVCILACAFFENDALFPRAFFMNKRFIELGSGVGLLGIALGTAGANIVLTDQEKMIPRLKENVTLNAPLYPRTGTSSNGGSVSVRVASYSWGSALSGMLQDSRGFDVIVASDVLYEEEGIMPLLAALDKLRKPTNAKSAGKSSSSAHSSGIKTSDNEESMPYECRNLATLQDVQDRLRESVGSGATVAFIATEHRFMECEKMFFREVDRRRWTLLRVPAAEIDPIHFAHYDIGFMLVLILL